MSGMAALYGRALVRQLPLVGARGGDTLPGGEQVRQDVPIERDALRAYDRVCGFRLSDLAPPTYLHILAFPLALRLMTSGEFPFGVMGLVHIANRIEQRRAVRPGEAVTLRVRAADLADHGRGRQFDIVCEAAVGGEAVWHERSTYLRRESGSSGARKQSTPPRGGAVWRVPDGVGRAYARISGDRNPIHLHPLAARLFGQKGTIAHGMWCKARCLAALEGRVPEACAVDAAFKTPVPLGSKVAFTSRAQGGRLEFALMSARDGRPHVAGAAGPLG